MNWEDAVKSLRENPANNREVLDNYFEADIMGSCQRFFESEEFKETRKKIPISSGKLLDIGAGRGISSYAFWKSGFQVSALEPDTSNDVGSGAIRYINNQLNAAIEITEAFGEKLPFADNSFDIIYARQVLHHAQDLNAFVKECFRVLKPGGIMFSVRDHVISNAKQKEIFLQNHLLHRLYGGENAFTKKEYISAYKNACFSLTEIIGSYDSAINYFPATTEQLQENVRKKFRKLIGKSLSSLLLENNFFYRIVLRTKSLTDNNPGRLISILATKPQ